MINKNVNLISQKNEYTVLLQTISGKPIGQIPSNAIDTIKREVGKPSEIEFEIPRYYMDTLDMKNKEYPLFNEIKNERQIMLDNSEVYSIKLVERANDEVLKVTARSREVRLKEIEIVIEDCGFVFYEEDAYFREKRQIEDSIRVLDEKLSELKGKKLAEKDSDLKQAYDRKITATKDELKEKYKELSKLSKDREQKNKYGDLDILSLDEYMYEQTGWRVGTVTDKVRYDDVDKHIEALRWQENVDKKWYDFLTTDIAEGYDCLVLFDSFNKTVSFCKEEELGNDIGLYLSKDNYIRDMTRIFDSDKLVTRMTIEGNEEMDIIHALATGYPYIENYSYFIENNEMSEELINALETYYDIVAKREVTWAGYVKDKEEKLTQKKILGTEFIDCESQIFALSQVYDIYNKPPNKDVARASEIIAKITVLRDKSQDAQTRIKRLDRELDALEKSIDNIVLLCQKPTATDDDGKLIFNQKLLDELKEYLYTESYKNDSFLTENVGQLIEVAKKKLRDKCRPTFKWELDVVNFLQRVQPIDKLSWTGEIGLGDIVILYDREENKEEFVYFTGYTHKVRENDLELTLSNKKTNKSDGLVIADYLIESKNVMRELDAKKYLLIQQKYNRLNVPREYIGKYKEKPKKRPEGTTID